jgi:hypothetical protein
MIGRGQSAVSIEADAHHALPIRLSGGRARIHAIFMHAKSVHVPIGVDTRAMF